MTCTNCGTDNKEEYRFCANCGNELVAEEPDEGVRGHRPQPVVKKNTGDDKPLGLAIASFFIPGLGHFINGNTKKGAMLLGGAFLLIITGIGYFFVGAYSAYDVYQNGGR